MTTLEEKTVTGGKKAICSGCLVFELIPKKLLFNERESHSAYFVSTVIA
jgi:hypothetical protein